MIPANKLLKVLASAARTAETTSDEFDNLDARGVMVTVDVTAVTDTPSITPIIQGQDPVSLKWENLLSASAAIVATGTHSYLVYPGVGAASGDIVQVAGFPLPRKWRVKVTHADADSITYSIGANLLI